MNFNYIKNIAPIAAVALSMGLSSCTKDLDVTPIDPSSTMEVDEVALYTKCYSNMAMQGQNGAGNDDCDIEGYDGGTVGFVRQIFNSNELSTDEAICGWGDTGIPAFNKNQWDASHPMMEGFYYRLYTGIAYCNHYLETCSGISDQRTAEVRFLRCLYYYYLMDSFGNVSFTTSIAAQSPEQIMRADLYSWIEAELLGKAVSFQTYSNGEASQTFTREAGEAIIDGLPESTARTSSSDGYGTVDQDAVNLLLARMYLNAKVYKGLSDFAKEDLQNAKTYAEKVINGKHQLFTNRSDGDKHGKATNGFSAYQMLFMGDNGESGASVEAILPILQDGVTTTSWCTSLFLMASTWQSDMDTDNNYGTSEFWAGNRSRSNLVKKFFPDGNAPQDNIKNTAAAAGDDRALFFGIDRKLTAETPGQFTDGYSVGKFRNTYSSLGTPHHAKYVDMDFFLMRSAEAYLIAAECDARLNSGYTTSQGKGTEYINDLRERANASTEGMYSLDEILDERSRELYFEGYRRTDLIRYGYFGGANSSSYIWEWKGGVLEGKEFDSYLNLYAIPSADLIVNKNLKQNTGY